MSNEFDAVGPLPYVDTEYSQPGVREAVDALIAMEMKTFRPRDYLSYLPPPPLPTYQPSSLLAKELARVAQSQSLPDFDAQRYESKPPSAAARNSVEAWMRAIANAEAQLEHQNNRSVNLELGLKYGKAAWLAYNSQLEAMVETQEHALAALSADIQQLNLQRTMEQKACGARLAELEQQWGTLIAKNVDLKNVCSRLEAEISAYCKEAAERNIDVSEQMAST